MVCVYNDPEVNRIWGILGDYFGSFQRSSSIYSFDGCNPIQGPKQVCQHYCLAVFWFSFGTLFFLGVYSLCDIYEQRLTFRSGTEVSQNLEAYLRYICRSIRGM